MDEQMDGFDAWQVSLCVVVFTIVHAYVHTQSKCATNTSAKHGNEAVVLVWLAPERGGRAPAARRCQYGAGRGARSGQKGGIAAYYGSLQIPTLSACPCAGAARQGYHP